MLPSKFQFDVVDPLGTPRRVEPEAPVAQQPAKKMPARLSAEVMGFLRASDMNHPLVKRTLRLNERDQRAEDEKAKNAQLATEKMEKTVRSMSSDSVKAAEAMRGLSSAAKVALSKKKTMQPKKGPSFVVTVHKELMAKVKANPALVAKAFGFKEHTLVPVAGPVRAKLHNGPMRHHEGGPVRPQVHYVREVEVEVGRANFPSMGSGQLTIGFHTPDEVREAQAMLLPSSMRLTDAEIIRCGGSDYPPVSQKLDMSDMQKFLIGSLAQVGKQKLIEILKKFNTQTLRSLDESDYSDVVRLVNRARFEVLMLKATKRADDAKKDKY